MLSGSVTSDKKGILKERVAAQAHYLLPLIGIGNGRRSHIRQTIDIKSHIISVICLLIEDPGLLNNSSEPATATAMRAHFNFLL